MRNIVGLTRATSGTATVAGRSYAGLPNPGLEVGVLLDASAQHAGRTGREILTIAQRFMGLSRQRVGSSREVLRFNYRTAHPEDDTTSGQSPRHIRSNLTTWSRPQSTGTGAGSSWGVPAALMLLTPLPRRFPSTDPHHRPVPAQH